MQRGSKWPVSSREHRLARALAVFLDELRQSCDTAPTVRTALAGCMGSGRALANALVGLVLTKEQEGSNAEQTDDDRHAGAGPDADPR
jgi:hypothetical protein